CRGGAGGGERLVGPARNGPRRTGRLADRARRQLVASGDSVEAGPAIRAGFRRWPRLETRAERTRRAAATANDGELLRTLADLVPGEGRPLLRTTRTPAHRLCRQPDRRHFALAGA